jgi:L-fuconolactonase
MPQFPIIDTHVHLWDPHRVSYPWMAGNTLLDRHFGIEDYQRASQHIETEAMVFVECDAEPAQSLQEMEWVLSQAQRDGRIRAIVARAPLECGRTVAPLLEKMMTRSSLLRGVRRILQFEPDPGALMRNPSFIEGVTLLEELGLHFEMTVDYTQMDSAIEFTKQIPGVPIILDHCGKPGIRGNHIALFRRQMADLARHPNVVCKLSGLATEADPAHWTSEDLQPFIDATVDAFGVARVLYGGDWPVCLQAASLQRWIDVLDHALAGLSPTDLRNIYRDNANRFYRLGM